MTALYIILGVLAAIILLLVILLHFSVHAYIEADKKHVDVVVKYFGFTVFKAKVPDTDKPDDEPPEPEGSETQTFELSEIPETDSTEKPEETSDSPGSDDKPTESNDKADTGGSEDKNDTEPNDGEPSLINKYNAVKKYIPAGKKAFRKLLKLIRFRNFTVDLTVGNDDPYKAGMNFGRINALFYNILALLCCLFSVKINRTDIKCDFERKTFDFYFKTEILVRPSALISLLLYVGVYYLIIRCRLKKLENKTKKENNNE